MAANAGAVYSGLGQDLVTGTWNTAPYGTALPTTDNTFFDASLNVAFDDGGYIGESGVALNQGRSFTDIKDMDGTAIDTIQTDSNGTVAFTAMELNDVVLGAVFGSGNVTTTSSTLSAGTRHTVALSLGEDVDPRSHVFRMKSGAKRAGLIIPRGRITDTGSITWSSAGAATLDLTIKAIPVYDAGLSKNVDMYLFLDDGVFAVALVPVITSILPSGQAVGESIAIQGSRFTGATSVKFGGSGGTNATSFEVINDTLITAVLPAGSAGAVSGGIVVANASGNSTGFAYTRA